jgi:hypothetical protein
MILQVGELLCGARALIFQIYFFVFVGAMFCIIFVM